MKTFAVIAGVIIIAALCSATLAYKYGLFEAISMFVIIVGLFALVIFFFYTIFGDKQKEGL